MHSTIGFAMSDEASENKPDTKARLFETNPDLLQKDNEVKLELVQESPDAEQNQDPFVGRTLLDKYEVLSFVGTGGMSTVYKARNKLLDSYCALKVLHKHLWQDPRAQERFRMEAKAINELMHPNLVTLKDYGVTSDGDPVLVMEFLDGIDLSKKITDEGRLPLDKVVEIFMALCKGLSQAHKKGIVHRDIKPANIMFDEHSISFDAGGVKLVDFGIAKIINDDVNEINKLTQTGEVFGSPFYMSPEQCMGETIDQRSDVYALGCLIYEAVTGQPPVYASAILDAFYKQVNEVPKPFQEVREEFKFQKEFDGVDLEDLQFIVFKCFEKVPSDRYQTVDEILIDLNRLLAKEKFTREEAPVGDS